MANETLKDTPERLGDIFEHILGSQNVYFQPPSNKNLETPCVIFSLSYADMAYADNKPYILVKQWEVELIDKSPRSPFVDDLLKLPYISFVRHFNDDNRNHWIFRMYY